VNQPVAYGETSSAQAASATPPVGHLALAAVCGLALVCAWIVGDGFAGSLYVALYALAGLPGLPIGFLLFGSRHPASWVAGMLFGYVLTALAIWLAIATHVPSAPTMIVVWAVIAAATWQFWRRQPSAPVPLQAWRSADSLGLAVILALTLAIATPPLARVGEVDAIGEHRYRAYFTADFVWHTALAAELSKFTMPPRNPYLASQTIHYYWAYFLLPAAVSTLAPGPLADLERCLKVNALATGLVLMSMVFLAAWVAVGQVLAVAIAVALALIAASAEGTYELVRLWSLGQPFVAMRDINIDAITAWHFRGLRLDGLPRCLWYVPQHSMSYALGLIALTAAAAVGSAGTLAVILLCGVAIGGATMLNPFVGGLFAVAWAGAIALDALKRPRAIVVVARHAIAAVPVVLALVWCFAAHMVDGAGDSLAFGFWGPPAYSTVTVLLLSLGPVLIPAALGLIARTGVSFSRLLPSVVLVGISLAVMHLVRLRVDTAWVPFRAGQMLLVVIPALIARGLAADRPRVLRVTAVTVCVLALAIGAPTTIIDARNAQDVDDLDAGPGFHWTLVLHPEEEQALHWIRTMTPPNALVQMEPTVRDRDTAPGGWGERWSLIPSFAERRMAAGLPISLMRVPEYAEKTSLVRTAYQSASAHEAWTIARHLHIAYLYVDALDRQTYEGAAKFDRAPEFFTPVFKAGDVGVYAVR